MRIKLLSDAQPSIHHRGAWYREQPFPSSRRRGLHIDRNDIPREYHSFLVSSLLLSEKSNTSERARWAIKRGFVGAAVGDWQGGFSASDRAGHRKSSLASLLGCKRPRGGTLSLPTFFGCSSCSAGGHPFVHSVDISPNRGIPPRGKAIVRTKGSPCGDRTALPGGTNVIQYIPEQSMQRSVRDGWDCITPWIF